MRSLGSLTIDTIDTLYREEDEVSELSYISDAEPSACMYKLVVNPKVKDIGNQGDV